MQQIYTEKYRELMERAIPSARGLYPPEILMLDYAPHYKSNENSFQQFWGWYAVEDPLQLLHSLEERGFLENAGLETTLNKLTIPEIKELLRSYNLPPDGRKGRADSKPARRCCALHARRAFPLSLVSADRRGQEGT